MASAAKLKEKRQAEVMEIRRQEPNKTCAECNERVCTITSPTTYVCSIG
jgi:ArsR family metal-binding transcriptional regulator